MAAAVTDPELHGDNPPLDAAFMAGMVPSQRGQRDDDPARTWQLVMTGNGLHRITPDAQADMARLLDLDPSISHLTVEVGDDSIHVARDWPSDRMEEADRLIDRIASSGVSAIVVHDRNGKPPRRVMTSE